MSLLISAALTVAGVNRGKRWRAKHRSDSAPQVPVVAGVSAFTGEIITTGQSNTELGDGNAPESPYP